MRVSNAEGPTAVQIALSKRTRQRNVPCVAGTTRQTTKAVNTTITLSEATKKEQGIYRDLHVAAEMRRMVESLAPEAARRGPLPSPVSAPAFPPAPALLLLTLALLLLTLPLLSGTKVR